MILADTKEERIEALKKLEKMQQEDFEGILKAMHDLPVTIRLLDPPLTNSFLMKTKSFKELQMKWEYLLKH
jgi:phosphoenolpyruvate synthase/pyruvate phosphate dikinase